mmetsp:Transcript_14485/g.36660  ORF Transcript_14485/g.36660 Transcript_14485/m.36660 type:complete len:258 (+) Transcript_14485:394-1167(+)
MRPPQPASEAVPCMACATSARKAERSSPTSLEANSSCSWRSSAVACGICTAASATTLPRRRNSCPTSKANSSSSSRDPSRLHSAGGRLVATARHDLRLSIKPSSRTALCCWRSRSLSFPHSFGSFFSLSLELASPAAARRVITSARRVRSSRSSSSTSRDGAVAAPPLPALPAARSAPSSALTSRSCASSSCQRQSGACRAAPLIIDVAIGGERAICREVSAQHRESSASSSSNLRSRSARRSSSRPARRARSSELA